jgi:hypothetical protein
VTEVCVRAKQKLNPESSRGRSLWSSELRRASASSKSCFLQTCPINAVSKILHFLIRWICWAILDLKTPTAFLTVPWCIISLARVSGQPTLGFLLAIAVKYQFTKALPLSSQQLNFTKICRWLHPVHTARMGLCRILNVRTSLSPSSALMTYSLQFSSLNQHSL